MNTSQFEREPFGNDNSGLNTESEAVNPSIEIAQRIGSYIEYVENASAEQETVLRPHQLDVFKSLKAFFDKDQRRGYIELPTGTGKTVLFVELSKALLGVGVADEVKRPKILVVTPTKDLVHQTLGRQKEKGYGRFAPELKVGSFFSDSSGVERKEIGSFDVVVTTYRSFDTLSKSHIYRPVTDFSKDVMGSNFFKRLVEANGYERAVEISRNIKEVPTDQMLLDAFDVVIFDETHHVFGDTTKKIVQSLPKDKILIGFSATPDADELKKISNLLPHKIHEMGLVEAISLGLASPVVPVGISSGMRIEDGDIYDDRGEFIDDRISYLAQDPVRNERIIKAAKIFAQNNIGTIVSCMKGDEAWHARHIAELAIREGIRAVAVYDKIPTVRRNEIYKRFEKGEIDLLSFIGVIGEGWDNARAKALINARPSRSRIFTKQRLGRTTRPGNPAFVIDVLDAHDGKNPPITAADIFEDGDIAFGSAIGTVDSNPYVSSVLASLQEQLPVADVLKSEYIYVRELIATLPKLERGGVITNRRGNADYAIASVANRSYVGLTDEIIGKIEEQGGSVIDKKIASRNGVVKLVYQVDQLQRLLHDLPEADPLKYHIDQGKQKWISKKGILQLFSKRFPGLEEHEVEMILSKTDVDWMVAVWEKNKDPMAYRHIQVFKMYRADQASIELMSQALEKYLRNKSLV